MEKHALVFGASGILGWGVVDQILKGYPRRGAFSKVTALSHRPLDEKTSLWPAPETGVPRLHITDGIDLTQGTPESVADVLRTQIPSVDTVTHVYFFGKC
jgi:hypothetical protein